MMAFLRDTKAGASDLAAIIKALEDGTLPAKAVRRGTDGDVRYWGVDPNSNPFLAKFVELARSHATRVGLAANCTVVLMANDISAERSPEGSGGGWHVDSVRRQYKLFCYLTDCLDVANGPFTLLGHPLRPIEFLAIAANRLFGGGSRWSPGAIRFLKSIGFREKPVFSEAGVPFFVATNRIHRGLPITSGRRMMVTAYIFERDLPLGVQQQLSLAA